MSNTNNIVPPKYDFQKRAPQKASVLLLEFILLILVLLGSVLFYYDFIAVERIEIIESYHIVLWVVLSILFFMDFAGLAFLTKNDKLQVMHDPPYIIR